MTLRRTFPKFGDRPNAVQKGVAIMTSKILTIAAAFALATTAGLATTAPASARHMHAHWNPGYVAADIAGGLIGGALATATMPFWGTDYYGYPGSYYPG